MSVSIQRQLRRQWLASLLLITLPLLWIADIGVRHVSANYIISRLDHDIDTLISGLTQDPASQQLSVDAEHTGGLYERTYSGHYYAIYDDSGVRLSSRSLWDQPAPEWSVITQRSHWVGDGMNGQEWLNLSRPTTINGQPLTIWVAEDITPLHDELMTYRIAALVILLAALGAVALLQTQVIRRAFSTLAPLQQQLKELRLGQREQLATQEHPEEIAPLASEIDRLLALMDERSSRTRNAIGNLAHEMKRPLQQLQLLSENALKDQPEHSEISTAVSQLNNLIQRELKRARILGTASPGRHFHPADDIPPLIDVLTRIYPQVRISTEGINSIPSLPFDRDDLLELCGNLLDNACRYGRGDVRLTLNKTDSGWILEISDNGPGIPENQRGKLLQRGTRLDEQQEQGTGLGLSIAHDIVQSCGGSLELKESEAGGLCAEVWLPAITSVS